MANVTSAAFTITLASLANGSARQSTMISNTGEYPGVIIYVKLTCNGTPTANNVATIYLLRGDDATSSTYRTDGAGASDAAITDANMQVLGSMKCAGTLNEVLYGDFDTAPLGPLGPEWGIAVKNSTGVALNATEGNHVKRYSYHLP